MKSPRQNPDRLSFLHESVRQKIIHFLPMEDAIRTSVLSKNWRSVCSSLPNLEFDDWHCYEKQCKNPSLGDFRDMVDQTLILHDQSDIHTLKIVIDRPLSPVSTRHLNSWICFAVRHNVQHIYLQMCDTIVVEKLPMCLFTCNTLSVLRLDDIRLHLPSTIAFPLLKTLYFHRVKFVDKNQMNKLLSGSSCPVLEVVNLTHCSQDHNEMHTISFPHLEYLSFSNNFHDRLKLKISIPHLHKFEYEGNEPPNLTPATLSSIACASFTISPDHTEHNLERIIDYGRTVLLGIGDIEELILWEDFLEFLMRNRCFSKCLATLCCSLKVLHLSMSATKNQVEATTLFLRKFPNLQTLRVRFYQEDCNSSNVLDLEEYWLLNKDSVQKHLKQVQIELFQGSENELDLVKYILGTTVGLEKMTINFVEYACENVQCRMKVCQKLLTFTRVSPNAAIIFW